jgi:hypothetical protein
MTIAFVVGNGVSRCHVSLPHLKTRGSVYACNAVYREFEPDVLVATDRPISAAIQDSGYALRKKFYTRRPLPELGALTLPPCYFGYSSGPNAVGLAARDHHARIYLLGFDMGPDQNQQFNNMYANTEFYKKNGSTPTYTGNWIKQLCHVVKDHPQIDFVRIHGVTTAKISEFEHIKNMRILSLDTFMDCINNEKEL